MEENMLNNYLNTNGWKGNTQFHLNSFIKKMDNYFNSLDNL